MNNIPIETVGIGAVAIAIISALVKLLMDSNKRHTDLTQQVIAVVERNAVASEKQASASGILASSIKDQGKFLELLTTLITKKK